MQTTKKSSATKKASLASAVGEKSGTAKAVSVSKSATPAKAKKKIVSKKATVTPCACTTRCKPEYAFWVNNGPILETVVDLQEALASMTDEQYRYHTSREGNDFARWVRECVGDDACAERIARAKTRTTMVRALMHACCGAENK